MHYNFHKIEPMEVQSVTNENLWRKGVKKRNDDVQIISVTTHRQVAISHRLALGMRREGMQREGCRIKTTLPTVTQTVTHHTETPPPSSR